MQINNFTNGLALSSPPDQIATGFTRSNRGLSRDALGSFRSRFGSKLIASLDAHSIFYFASQFWYGVGTSLYRGINNVLSGLSGNKLSFTKCPPVAGLADYLFLAGGGTLYKANSSGNISNWGIDVPSSSPTLGNNTSAYISIRNATYRWTQIGATAEYYCELAAGGNPSLPDPTHVKASTTELTRGTAVGSLTAGQFIYADPGALGFSTIIVRLSDSTDPDTKADDYITYTTSTTVLNGNYGYAITYKNSTTGHRSNGTTIVSITVTSNYIQLSAIPDGSLVDSQVDKIEIWRTGPNGSLLFLLTTINTGTTTFLDNGTLILSTTELPTDNNKPYAYFDDCLGPHNASIFWITRTQSGQRGRVYYTAIGRAEAMQGFIEVTSDDNPLQKLFLLQGQLGVIGESGIFLIGGDNPYVSRQVPEAPGTIYPNSVAVTPSGLVYLAQDGLRVFDGSTSNLLVPGAVERLYRGIAVGDLSAFSGFFAATATNEEYLISDGNQALAVNLAGRFRDLGIGFTAAFYSKSTNQLALNFLGSIIDFEVALVYTDNGSAISVILEPPTIATELGIEALLQFLTIDINTSNEQITAILTIDDVAYTLGTIQTSSRRKITFNVGKSGNIFNFRLIATLSTAQIEIFSITPEIYVPK